MNALRVRETGPLNRTPAALLNGGPGRPAGPVNSGPGRTPVARMGLGPANGHAGPATAALSQFNAPTVSVVVMDREALVRAGVSTLLQSAPGFEIAGEAEDFGTAYEVLRRRAAQVLVVGVAGGDPNALSLLEWARDNLPECGIVALISRPVPEALVFRILRTGAQALLDRAGNSADLVSAVRAVAAGEAVLAPWVTRRLLDRFVGVDVERSERASALIRTLTDREREVLALVARGTGNAEIARELYLSEGAVKANISKLLIKLRCQNRVQAACLAQSADLLR